MTVTEYREKYGANFKAHEGQPWFVALLQTLRDEHPLKALAKRLPGDRLNGAAVFLNEIKGYEDALTVIADISASVEPAPVESESTYPAEE